MEIEQRRQPKRKPTDENRRADIQNRTENRNRIRHDKRHDPEQRSERNPKRPRERVMHIDLVRPDLAHDGRVHVLDGREANDQPRAQHRRNQHSVRNLRGDLRCGAECRRGDGVACEAVDDACHDDVHDDLKALLHEQRGREVAGCIAHFCHDGDEGLIAGKCECNVEQRVHGLDERGFSDERDGDVETGRGARARDAQRDHDDEDGGHDGDGAYPAEQCGEGEFARQTQQPADEVGKRHERDCAQRVFGQRVERDGHGDVCGCADQDEVEDEGACEEDAKRLGDDVCAVHEVGDQGVSPVELNQNVPAVGGEHAEAQDGDDAGYQAEGFESSG
jgi:hypothetical protein